MHKIILSHNPQTISWFNNEIVDWSKAGTSYALTGQIRELNKYHFGFNFDASICSTDGKYAFIYQKLGTKGLLLKNGEILREINRSYYCADSYEYPAAFFTFGDRVYLAHCPVRYCQLEFEDVETGELITGVKARKPSDIFHSRLEISPNNEYLMSKGWVWHPIDVIQVYKIADCFSNPLLLDRLNLNVPDVGVEISTASFIDDSKILIGSSDEVIDHEKQSLPSKSLAVWDFTANRINLVGEPDYQFGNLVAIDQNFAWDVYRHPKVINLLTGEIVDKDEEIFSGDQTSSICQGAQPLIAFSQSKDKLAIVNGGKIVVLSPL